MGIITICYSIQKRIEGIDVLSCTFAGHREVYEKDAAAKIECAVHQLIEKDERFCFYTGGMGEFDCMCERTIRRIKKECTDKEIRLILVEPYMKQSINTEGRYLKEKYDEILIPSEWAECHYKRSIVLRNRWMVDHSQYMIAHVGKKLWRRIYVNEICTATGKKNYQSI